MSALFLCLFIPIPALAAPLYNVDDSGNLIIDSVIDESTGEVTDLPDPITDDTTYEEVISDAGLNSDDLSTSESETDSLSTPEDLLEAQEASDQDFNSMDAPSAVLYADRAASVGNFDPENCIIYSASYGSNSGYLLIPASYYEQIYIDDSGVIWNVGNGNISCRFVSSLGLSDSDYNISSVTIYSAVQDNASTIYNERSLTRIRTYYQSSSRLTYTDYWGAITTADDLSNLQRSPIVSVKLGLYMILAVLLIGGFLCYRKRSVIS